MIDTTQTQMQTQTPAPADRSFLFLLASSRLGGNTETLARQAAEHLPAEVEQRWLRLNEIPLPPFVDRRHDGDGVYPEPEGNARLLVEATLAATDIVVASPLYWYSLAADAKLYLDHWAGWMRVPGLDFRARLGGKTLWAVTALTTEDRSPADPLVGTLQHTGQYMGMRWGGALLGLANRPGQILQDVTTLERARSFFAS